MGGGKRKGMGRMRRWTRSGQWAAALAVLLGATGQEGAWAQTVRLRSVSLLGREDAWTVHIASTGPLHPQASTLADPPRLVIDLPGASVPSSLHNLHPAQAQVRAVRVGRQSVPGHAVAARVVIDLDEERTYSLAATSTGLNIHLGTPVAPALAYAPERSLLQLAAFHPARVALAESAMPAAAASPASHAGKPVAAPTIESPSHLQSLQLPRPSLPRAKPTRASPACRSHSTCVRLTCVTSSA